MRTARARVPSYYAWWEMYPTNDIQIAYGVFPGDFITASVTYASGKFKIVVNDTTTAHRHSFSTTQTCASGLDLHTKFCRVDR